MDGMDFRKHLEVAWNTTLRHIALLILMTVVSLVVSALTAGILFPVVMAGFTHSIIRLMRDGREPRIEDLFSQMGLFLPLCGFSIVVFIAVVVGFFLLVLPGLAVVFAVTFGCLYLLPLMTDQKLNLVDAIKTSWKMAFDDSIADHIVAVILFMGLLSIGTSVFVGFVLTQPFAFVFLISVYLEKTNQGTQPVA
jgi:membrane-anchored glycerophosphoryl diester phosphodiesterase (GDPDase)